MNYYNTRFGDWKLRSAIQKCVATHLWRTTDLNEKPFFPCYFYNVDRGEKERVFSVLRKMCSCWMNRNLTMWFILLQSPLRVHFRHNILQILLYKKSKVRDFLSFIFKCMTIHKSSTKKKNYLLIISKGGYLPTQNVTLGVILSKIPDQTFIL